MSHDPSRNKLEIVSLLSCCWLVVLWPAAFQTLYPARVVSPPCLHLYHVAILIKLLINTNLARGNSNIPLHRRLHRSDRHPDLCSIPSTRRTAPSYHMRRRSPLRGPIRHNAIHRALSSPCGSETTRTAIHVEPARSCLGRSCSAIPFPWSFCIPKSWLSDSAFPFLWWPWG